MQKPDEFVMSDIDREIIFGKCNILLDFYSYLVLTHFCFNVLDVNFLIYFTQ